METQIARYLDRFITYYFLNEAIVYKFLWALFQIKPISIYILADDVFTTDRREWQRIFKTNDKNDVTAMATIICPMGFLLVAIREHRRLPTLTIYVRRLRNNEVIQLLYNNTRPLEGAIFVSSRFTSINREHFLPYLQRPWNHICHTDSSSWVVNHFPKYIRWKIRKPAFLVAMRIKNGNFFHVLKLIVLFL
jgi:hypothetical protein